MAMMEEPLSPSQMLDRVNRVERNLAAADKDEMIPKLAHLRAAIGEMTVLYEQRLQEVKTRNQQALDELRQLAGRVTRKESRELKAEEKKEDDAPGTGTGGSSPESNKENSKKKDAPNAKEGEAPSRSKRTRSRRKKASAPALPVNNGALTAGWLAQAVPPVVGAAEPAKVAEAMAPWFRAAEALRAESQVSVQAYPPSAPTPSVSPTRTVFGKLPAPSPFGHAYTPYIPDPTPSPSWEPENRVSVGGLLKRPVGFDVNAIPETPYSP